MSSTWIGTPVENAKEVTERYLNKLFTIDGLGAGNYIKENCTLTYDSDCEVFFADYDIRYNIRPQDGYVYYGMIYVNTDNSIENNLKLALNTGTDNEYTLDCSATGIHTSSFPIIFNEVAYAPVHANSFFIGYKFLINNP